MQGFTQKFKNNDEKIPTDRLRPSTSPTASTCHRWWWWFCRRCCCWRRCS